MAGKYICARNVQEKHSDKRTCIMQNVLSPPKREISEMRTFFNFEGRTSNQEKQYNERKSFKNKFTV